MKHFLSILATFALFILFGLQAITAKAESCHVSFEFNDDMAKSYITKVSKQDINGDYSITDIENFADGFYAESGMYIYLYINAVNENMTVKKNGSELTAPQYGLNYYGFRLDANSTIEVVYTPPLSFTAYTNNYEGVELGYKHINPWYTDYIDLKQLTKNGENTITMPNSTINSVFVRPKDGFTLESVTVDDVEVEDLYDIPVTQDMKLSIIIYNGGETPVEPAGSVTFSCDDFSKVNVTFNKQEESRKVRLTSNSQSVEYYPGEDHITIEPVNADFPITRVKLGKTILEGNPEKYDITGFNSQDVITVYALPFKNVSFEFSNDQAKAYITEVTADDLKVEHFADGFSAPSGCEVKLYVNSYNAAHEIKVNGNPAPISETEKCTTFTLNEDPTKVIVSYNAFPTLTIDVNHHEGIEAGYTYLWEDYYPMDAALTLDKDGENVFTIKENNVTKLYVKCKDGYVIESVKADGETVANPDNITFTNGMKLSIIVNPEQKDDCFSISFEFENEECAAYIQSVEAANKTIADFAQGFEAPEGTIIVLKRTDPIDSNFEVSINGEVVTFQTLFRKYEFTLTQNTIVKVTKPGIPSMSINVNTAAHVWIGWIEPSSIPGLPGTNHMFDLNDGDNTVSLPYGCNIIYIEPAPMTGARIKTVKLNDEVLDETAYDEFSSIPVKRDDRLEVVTTTDPASVANLLDEDDTMRVYDLTGKLIIKNASSGDLINLEEGIYIIGNRKVRIHR